MLLAFFFVSHAWASDRPYMSDVGQLNYARFLHSQGDYLRAAREFERVIELFPLSPLIPEAHFMLAESYFDAGDLKEARDQFLQFLDNSTDGPFAPFADEARLRLLKIKKLLAETEKVEGPREPGHGETGGVKTAKKLPVEGVKPGFTVTKPLRPLRAVQVMFFSGASYEEMERELEGLKSAGVDTVILRVFHNTGDRHHRFVEPRSPAGVYFKTDHAPVVADVLAKVLEAAHEKGLKVFAWMTTRHADYGLEGMAELACKGYDIATGKIVRCRGLDMFNEKAVRHLEGLFSDLASYPIDGVLFQDDLILRHTEGFGAHAERLFKKQRGISIDPAKFYIRGTGTASVLYTASFWEWAAWKNKRLLTVAGRLKRAVRERNPRVEFAINMMYESVTNPPYALAWLSQDLATAATAGFDYYSIMAYHRQMSEELEKSPGEIKEIIGKMVEEALRVVGDPHKVLIKLQTIDWKTEKPLSPDEVAELIDTIRTIEDVSIAVVPYRVDFPFYELGKTGAKGPGKDNGYNPTRAGNVKDF